MDGGNTLTLKKEPRHGRIIDKLTELIEITIQADRIISYKTID